MKVEKPVPPSPADPPAGPSAGQPAANDGAFGRAWQALGDQEVFYIEDDRGDGLMGRVRRANGAFPAPAKAAPEVETPTAGALRDVLTYEDVSPIVRRQLINVKACYLRLSRTGSSRSGRMILTFTVEPKGTVSEVTIDAPAFAETSLPACVSQQVQRWSFPPSKKGGLAVSYPLVFVGG